MAKHAPYYRASSAVERGAKFGATIGVLGSIAAIALSPGLVAGIPLGIVGIPIAGALAGIAVGAPLFGVANIITRIVPGLSNATGEDRPPQHLHEQHHSMRNGQYTNVTSPADYDRMQENMNQKSSSVDSVDRSRIEQERLAGIT